MIHCMAILAVAWSRPARGFLAWAPTARRCGCRERTSAVRPRFSAPNVTSEVQERRAAAGPTLPSEAEVQAWRRGQGFARRSLSRRTSAEPNDKAAEAPVPIVADSELDSGNREVEGVVDAPHTGSPDVAEQRTQRKRHAVPQPRQVRAISPSSASDFRQCPRLFKYRHIDRMWEGTSPVLLRGVLIHEALAKLYELPPEERSVDRLHGLFKVAWTNSKSDSRYATAFKSKQEEREWLIQSVELLSNFMLVEAPKITHPVHVEHRIFSNFDNRTGGMNVTGVLDRLDRGPDKGLIVIDYKTGRAPTLKYSMRVNMKILNDKFFQLKIYALLVQRSFGEMPRQLKLVYLDGPTTMTFPLQEKELLETEATLREIWDGILKAVAAQEFPPIPSRLCGWCSFKPICPAWAVDSEAMYAEGVGTGFGEGYSSKRVARSSSSGQRKDGSASEDSLEDGRSGGSPPAQAQLAARAIG